MEAEYLQLQKLEDEVIDYDKLSPSKKREPLRKQNSSPPVVPKEEIIAITLQKSEASSPDLLNKQAGEKSPSDKPQSINLVTCTTEQEE